MLVKVNIGPSEEVEQVDFQVVVLHFEGSRDTGASEAEATLDSQPAHLLRRNLNGWNNFIYNKIGLYLVFADNLKGQTFYKFSFINSINIYQANRQ